MANTYSYNSSELDAAIAEAVKDQVVDNPLRAAHYKEMLGHIRNNLLIGADEVIWNVNRLSNSHIMWANIDRQIPTVPPYQREQFWTKFAKRISDAEEVMAELLEKVEVHEAAPHKETKFLYNRLYIEFDIAAEPSRPLPGLLAQNPPPSPPKHRGARQHFEDLLASLQWSESIATHLQKKAVEQKAVGGARPDEHNHRLVKELADLFEKATGKEAKRPSYDAVNQQSKGTFLAFAAPCITALEPDLEWEAAASLIKRALKERISTVKSKASDYLSYGLLGDLSKLRS